MFQLGRAHFRGLGPTDARLDPLTLDFRNADGSPHHTVIWLANGGGKTTLLRLLFHVVRFGEARTIGKADARAQAALGGALGQDDVGHVLLEWCWTGAARSLDTSQEERLLTGLVCSWRRGRAGGGTGDIARHWYSLTARDGHPFDELTKAQVHDGHRTPHERYVDVLRQRARDHPQESVVLLDGLAKWEEHLGRVGLDSELFGTQVRMNHGEGGADEMLANIRSPADLVAFLLRTITPAEALEGIDAQLDGYATKLAERPTLERERVFVDELREAFEHLRARDDEHRVAREALDDVRQAARSLGAAARAAAGWHRAEADALGERRRAWQEESARHDNRRRDAARRATGLELWLGGEVARVARAAVEETAAAAGHSRLDAEAWRAVPSLARFFGEQDRIRDLRAQVDAADAETRPWRLAAEDALRTLVERLGALLSVDRDELAGVTRQRLILQDQARAHEQRRREAQGALELALAELSKVETKITAIDAEVVAARAAGHLEAWEEPTVAFARHAAALREAEARRRNAGEQRAAARDAADVATREAETARLGAQTLTHDLTSAVTEREERAAERAELATDERLLELLEATTIDLDLAGHDAITELRATADSRERARTTLITNGAADEHRLEHVAATGLLPASDDVTTVVAALRAQGLDVATGAEHLEAHGGADRERRLARDPGFGDAVVISGGAPTEIAERPMRAVPLREGEADLVLAAVQGHPGRWDATEAAAWAADAGPRAEERHRRAEELRAGSEDDRRLATRLSDHLDAWDATKRSKLDGAIDDLERRIVADRAAEEQADQRRQTARDAEEQAREDELEAEKVSAAARAAADAMTRLVTRIAPLADLRTQRADLATTVATERDNHDVAARGADSTREQDAALEGEAERTRTRVDRRAALQDRYLPRLTVAGVPDERPLQTNTTSDVDVLIARLDGADREVLRRSPPEALNAALREAERTAESVQADLPSDELILDRAGEMLRSPAGADHDARRRASEDAEQRAEDDRVAAARAHDTLFRADEAVDRLRSVADMIAPDPAPKDAATGGTLLAAIRREQEEATQAGRETETLLRETADSYVGMTGIAQRLSDAAEGLPRPHPDDPAPAPALVESLGDLSVVAARRNATQAAIDGANEQLGEAVERRDEAALGVQDVLVDARHEGLAETIRRNLRGLGSSLLVDRAASLIDELQRRAEMIADRLVTLEQDRAVVATTLAREVDGAVRALRRVQRRSTLPDGLGAWSGRPTVTFGGLDLPKEPTQITALVGGVVERLVTAERRPRGVDLLVQAVLEALDLTRLTARILKPTGGDPGEPQPVDQLPTFSGGQRATVAILLYATFARVRRDGLVQRGRDAGVGTLFLDNPLGKANAQFLIDRQLAVAHAAGIQLVYTTGIGDFDALDRFPVVIRLRNRGVVGRAMRRVLPDEQARAVTPDEGDGLEAAHQKRGGV